VQARIKKKQQQIKTINSADAGQKKQEYEANYLFQGLLCDGRKW